MEATSTESCPCRYKGGCHTGATIPGADPNPRALADTTHAQPRGGLLFEKYHCVATVYPQYRQRGEVLI